MERTPAARSHRIAVDGGVRLLGLLLLAVGGLAGHELVRVERPGLTPNDLTPELLAALLFFGMTVGAMLLTLGYHVFDRVAVSERWRRQRPAGRRERW